MGFLIEARAKKKCTRDLPRWYVDFRTLFPPLFHEEIPIRFPIRFSFGAAKLPIVQNFFNNFHHLPFPGFADVADCCNAGSVVHNLAGRISAAFSKFPPSFADLGGGNSGYP